MKLLKLWANFTSLINSFEFYTHFISIQFHCFIWWIIDQTVKLAVNVALIVVELARRLYATLLFAACSLSNASLIRKHIICVFSIHLLRLCYHITHYKALSCLRTASSYGRSFIHNNIYLQKKNKVCSSNGIRNNPY